MLFIHLTLFVQLDCKLGKKIQMNSSMPCFFRQKVRLYMCDTLPLQLQNESIMHGGAYYYFNIMFNAIICHAKTAAHGSMLPILFLSYLNS